MAFVATLTHRHQYTAKSRIFTASTCSAASILPYEFGLLNKTSIYCTFKIIFSAIGPNIDLIKISFKIFLRIFTSKEMRPPRRCRGASLSRSSRPSHPQRGCQGHRPGRLSAVLRRQPHSGGRRFVTSRTITFCLGTKDIVQ